MLYRLSYTPEAEASVTSELAGNQAGSAGFGHDEAAPDTRDRLETGQHGRPTAACQTPAADRSAAVTSASV